MDREVNRCINRTERLLKEYSALIEKFKIKKNFVTNINDKHEEVLLAFNRLSVSLSKLEDVNRYKSLDLRDLDYAFNTIEVILAASMSKLQVSGDLADIFAVMGNIKREIENIVEMLDKSYLDTDKTQQSIKDVMEEFTLKLENQKNRFDKILKEQKNKEALLEQKIKDYSQVAEQKRNNNTYELYEVAFKNNRKQAELYRVLFILTIIVAIVAVWGFGIMKPYLKLAEWDYWLFKGSMVLASLTLITYFLKQSTRYENLADQYMQTKLELEAFPSYVASLSTDQPEVVELRKTLAYKYFGRELQQGSANTAANNVMQEQLKISSDLAKVATELAKITNKN